MKNTPAAMLLPFTHPVHGVRYCCQMYRVAAFISCCIVTVIVAMTVTEACSIL